jgi:hypothetical protein
MDEPFLPWWLMLLLGMWAAAIVVWQHPLKNREVRLWAVALALVYLGLIFVALGCMPAANQVIPTACAVVSLISGIWMMGQISARSGRICYVVTTVANATFCGLVQGPEIACGLLLVAGVTAKPLIQEWYQSPSRSLRRSLAELIQIRVGSDKLASAGELWLAGGLCGILACLFIGTLSYALRIESTRTTSTDRFSVLPSRDLLDRINSNSREPGEESTLLDLVSGQRADVVVLLAAIVFLCLANSLDDPMVKAKTLAESVNDPPVPNPA